MSYRIVVPRTITTTLDFDGSNFVLNAPFSKDSWINELAAGSWDKKQNVWKLPPYIVYARTVLEQLPEIDVSSVVQARLEHARNEWIPMDPANPAYLIYREAFYPYQRETVDWLVGNPFKTTGLIALSPGLGKTIIALVAARLLQLEKVLIVAPKSLLRSWENEAMKFFGEVWFTRRAGQPPVDGWNLTNYDTVVDKVEIDKKTKRVVSLGGRLQEYLKVDWDLVILDESVLVKNRNTQRFKGMLALRKAFPRKEKCWWELSGYPVTRYYDDLWPQLHLQDPKAFGSYWRFAQRFCFISQDVWGTEITGNRGNVDITGDLADVVFVRNQRDVLSELPEEIPQLIEVDLTPKQLKAYDEMETSFVTKLESGVEVKTPIILGQLVRLQQIASNLVNIGGEDESAKADAITEMTKARSYLMPALIWTNWKPGAHALWARLGKLSNKTDGQITVEYVSGDFKDADNEEKFEAYKAGNIDILIVSMPVGKFGHNLQMTRTIIYHDKTWFADDYVQSMKRVKRAGLEHRPVVITVKAMVPIDQMIENNLVGKFPGIAKVSNEDLAAMFRHLRGGQA